MLLFSGVMVASARKSIDSSYVILPEIVIRSLTDDDNSFALSELCQAVPLNTIVVRSLGIFSIFSVGNFMK